MNSFTPKFKLIFIPLVLIAIGTVSIYTFFNWLLIIKLQAINVDEDWVKFFIPAGFSLIPLIIWLYPRLKMLKYKTTGRGDPPWGLTLLAWASISISTCIAQDYVEAASGTLTRLDRISEINNHPKTKYYLVKDFFIDKKQAGVKTSFEVSGKYNEHFDMTIYTVSPVFDQKPIGIMAKRIILPDSIKNILVVVNGKKVSANKLSDIDPGNVDDIKLIKGKSAVAVFGEEGEHGALLVKTKKPVDFDTVYSRPAKTTQPPIAWIALKFQKTISNKLEPNQKEEQYKVFAGESEKDFEARQLDQFVYLDRIGLSKDKKNYLAAVKSKDSTVNAPVIFKPVNEAFEARLGQKLPWIFGSFGIGASIFLIILLFIPLKETASAGPFDPLEESTSGWIDFKNIFLPREGYYFTPIIIDVNLLVYIIMVCCGLGFMTFNGNDLLKWGANFRPAVQNGEYWRLLTSVFLHGGLMHILFNMYGLMFVGIFLEPLMGSKRYLIAYLFTGILASLASVWWHPATIGVGASGAIFGMYGIFLALLTTNLFPHDFKKSFLVSTGIFVGYNLLFGLTGGIDNAAHIGGLISGLLIGYALYPSLKKRAREIDAEAETQELLDEITVKKEE